MNYYYLAASLPALTLDAPPPLSPAEFSSLCREHLLPGDWTQLEALLRWSPERDAPTGRFARAWQQRETALRNAIVRARAARTQRDPLPYLKAEAPFDLDAERAVAEAFARPNPADRELALDRYRWRVLDELGGLNPFASSALLAYALKLNLAQRWAGLSAEAGRHAAAAAVAAPPAA